MRLHVLTRKVQRGVEDYGWWITAKKILARLLAPVYERQLYIIYRADLEEGQPHEELETSDFAFRVLNPNDNSVIEQIEDMVEFLRGEVKEGIAAGDLCLVALHNGKLAGFNLITFGEVDIPLIKMKRVFRQREAWSVHIGVHKDFRKRGLGSQLRYRIFDELRRRGIKRLYGGTVPSYVANLKLSRRVGLREFVHVEYINLLGFKTRRYRRRRVRE
jgi:GNAT superfamily N-acetyltransferase